MGQEVIVEGCAGNDVVVRERPWCFGANGLTKCAVRSKIHGDGFQSKEAKGHLPEGA